MHIVNLTPHAIRLYLSSGEEVVFPPSGTVARVSQFPSVIEPIRGYADPRDALFEIPVTAARFGPVTDLPDPRDGVAYLVSGMVLSRCAGRKDVFGPGTGPLDSPVRAGSGLIEGVRCFIAAPVI